ncbi:MAG: heavy-metal-associated domain-containing protein [Rhodospirillales bacterium]|nr:heavy-metal-associated domain-containing protein [Rhodospirillales bacterium]
MKLIVEGMSCGHCVKAVTEALEGVSGVETVIGVSLETGEAVVEGSAPVSVLVAAIEEKGFDAREA